MQTQIDSNKIKEYKKWLHSDHEFELKPIVTGSKKQPTGDYQFILYGNDDLNIDNPRIFVINNTLFKSYTVTIPRYCIKVFKSQTAAFKCAKKFWQFWNFRIIVGQDHPKIKQYQDAGIVPV